MSIPDPLTSITDRLGPDWTTLREVSEAFIFDVPLRASGTSFALEGLRNLPTSQAPLELVSDVPLATVKEALEVTGCAVIESVPGRMLVRLPSGSVVSVVSSYALSGGEVWPFELAAVELPSLRRSGPSEGWSDLSSGVVSHLPPRLSSVSVWRQVGAVAASGLSVSADVLAACHKVPEAPCGVVARGLLGVVSAPFSAAGLEAGRAAGLWRGRLGVLSELSFDPPAGAHHKDVWTHTLRVVEGVPADDPELRLAALLHDVGKLRTRRVADGQVAFPNHESVGAHMARDLLVGLGFPEATVSVVERLVALHLRPHGLAGWSESAVRRLRSDAGPLFERLVLLSKADVTTRFDDRRRRIHDDLDALLDRAQAQEREESLAALRPPIDGRQVMARLGLAPGPKVGEVMRLLSDRVRQLGELSEAEAWDLVDVWAATNL